jgi:regulator of RNase E activity RraA
MHDRIIDYIRRNQISTTEVADCLGKSGALERISPLNRGHFCVGRVTWAYAWAESNWSVHEQLQDVPEGNIVLITEINCCNRSLIGDIVAKYLMLYRQTVGIVVDGYVRDASRLYKENWPIWAIGTNPIGCFNTRPENSPSFADLSIGDKYKDAIAVCDDTGVVIIEKTYCTEDFLTRLKSIEEQEDIWYDCIDRRKWSTFKTICQKHYLSE